MLQVSKLHTVLAVISHQSPYFIQATSTRENKTNQMRQFASRIPSKTITPKTHGPKPVWAGKNKIRPMFEVEVIRGGRRLRGKRRTSPMNSHQQNPTYLKEILPNQQPPRRKKSEEKDMLSNKEKDTRRISMTRASKSGNTLKEAK